MSSLPYTPSASATTLLSSLRPPYASPGRQNASLQTHAQPLPHDRAVLDQRCMPASSQGGASILVDSLSPREDSDEATPIPSPSTLLESKVLTSLAVSAPISREIGRLPSPDPDYNSAEESHNIVGAQHALATTEEAVTTKDYTAAPAIPSSSSENLASGDTIKVILLTPGGLSPTYIARRQDSGDVRLFLALSQLVETLPTVLCDVESCDPLHSTLVTGSGPASSVAAYAPSLASSAIAPVVAQPAAAVLTCVLSPDSAGNAEALSSHAETGLPQAGETEATECVQDGIGPGRSASDDHA